MRCTARLCVDTSIAKENTTYSTQTGHSYIFIRTCNGIHEVGTAYGRLFEYGYHAPQITYRFITALYSQPPKSSRHSPKATGIESHFFNIVNNITRPKQASFVFLATRPERTKQATNLIHGRFSKPPQDLPTTIRVNSNPLLTDFRWAKKGKLWKPSWLVSMLTAAREANRNFPLSIAGPPDRWEHTNHCTRDRHTPLYAFSINDRK